MSIYVISGVAGAGKSEFCVKIAEMYAKKDTRPIFSTFWLDVPGVEVVTWPEMLRQTEAVCIVDEAADFFQARNYASRENCEQLLRFRQLRQRGLTLFLVSQTFDTLDPNIRAMVSYIWDIQRLFGPDITGQETIVERMLGVWSRATLCVVHPGRSQSQMRFSITTFQTRYFRVDALYDRIGAAPSKVAELA